MTPITLDQRVVTLINTEQKIIFITSKNYKYLLQNLVSTNLKERSQHSSNIWRSNFRNIYWDSYCRDSSSKSTNETAKEQHPFVEGNREEKKAKGQQKRDDVHSKFSAIFPDYGSSQNTWNIKKNQTYINVLVSRLVNSNLEITCD